MDIDKFKKIIESCHLNFLFGSGASRNFFDTLGDVENLLTDLSSQPDSDTKQILEASIKIDYFNKAIVANIEILDGIEFSDEDEYLKTQRNYQDFLISLNVILLKRRSTLIGKQVNLFTTNMDLFFDSTIEELNLEYNDGFSGKLNPIFSTSNYRKSIFQKSPHYENKAEIPLFNLFKLHGSVTWKHKAHKIVFDQRLATLKSISKAATLCKDNIIKDINHNDGKAKSFAELYDEAESLQATEAQKKFINAYNKMVIINPTKDKFSTTTVQYTFYELLRMYSNELEKENSVLFVFGFSFADEHIREITKRVANSNPTLMICVFAYDDTAKEQIEKRLELMEFKFSNVEVMVAGDMSDLNQKWFSVLAKELDENLYSSKKNDITVNVTIPPAK